MAGYVVAADGQHGELVELYRTPHRPVAKAVATGIRAAGISARVFPADRVKRVTMPNPKETQHR